MTTTLIKSWFRETQPDYTLPKTPPERTVAGAMPWKMRELERMNKIALLDILLGPKEPDEHSWRCRSDVMRAISPDYYMGPCGRERGWTSVGQYDYTKRQLAQAIKHYGGVTQRWDSLTP